RDRPAARPQPPARARGVRDEDRSWSTSDNPDEQLRAACRPASPFVASEDHDATIVRLFRTASAIAGRAVTRTAGSSARQRHLRHDESIVRPGAEGHALGRPVDDDLLEQLEPRFLVVDDLGRLGVELLALLRVERVPRLLHQIVEALARLAADPVLS